MQLGVGNGARTPFGSDGRAGELGRRLVGLSVVRPGGAVAAVTGMVRLAAARGASVTRRESAAAGIASGPEGSTATAYSPAGPSTLSIRTWKRERSPRFMKRGRVDCATSWSRMITSREAAPTRVAVQAVASTRTAPSKAGISKEMRARPSAPTFTTPE